MPNRYSEGANALLRNCYNSELEVARRLVRGELSNADVRFSEEFLFPYQIAEARAGVPAIEWTLLQRIHSLEDAVDKLNDLVLGRDQ